MLNKRDQKKWDYALKNCPMTIDLIGGEYRSIEFVTKVANDPQRSKYQRNEAKQTLYMYEMIQRETGLVDLKDIQTYWVEQKPYKKYYSKKSKKDIEGYNYMPPPDRRDNKHTRVGSGCGGSGKIRYPKKVRKTAWKRFYKLFPNLDPKNKKEEQ